MSQRPVRNRLPTVPRGADPLTVIETLARRNLVEVSDTSPTISRQPPDTMMNSDDRLVGLPLPTQTQNAAEVTGAGHVAQETPDEENSDFEQPSEGDSDDTRGRAPASSGYEVVAPVPLSDEDMSEDEEDNYAVVAHASTTIFDHMDDQELAAAMSQIRNQFSPVDDVRPTSEPVADDIRGGTPEPSQSQIQHDISSTEPQAEVGHHLEEFEIDEMSQYGTWGRDSPDIVPLSPPLPPAPQQASTPVVSAIVTAPTTLPESLPAPNLDHVGLELEIAHQLADWNIAHIHQYARQDWCAAYIHYRQVDATSQLGALFDIKLVGGGKRMCDGTIHTRFHGPQKVSFLTLAYVVGFRKSTFGNMQTLWLRTNRLLSQCREAHRRNIQIPRDIRHLEDVLQHWPTHDPSQMWSYQQDGMPVEPLRRRLHRALNELSEAFAAQEEDDDYEGVGDIIN